MNIFTSNVRLQNIFLWLWVIILYTFSFSDGYRSTTNFYNNLEILPNKPKPSKVSPGSTDVSTKDSLQGINREDFPILFVEPYINKKLVYLDSAASSQKPLEVINAMSQYYKTSHSNVHRGAHALAMKATEQYEQSRIQIQSFVNAEHREEIVFTRGATEAINIVAMSYTQRLKPGDEIILSVMEHHSNLVPWQMAAERTGAILKFINLTEDMQLDMSHFHSLINEKTKIVAVCHASNVLGIVNPVEEIIETAHNVGAVVLLDACQSVPHMPINVQKLNVDFLVASSHKMCGPTGIGFLYGKLKLLESMPPVTGGGEMIDRVELQKSTYAQPPSRFEAGTPAIAEAIGFGRACEYLNKIGMDKIYQHEQALGKYLYEELEKINNLILYGPSTKTIVNNNNNNCNHRTGLVAFNSKTVHATDLSFFLDQEGVALRSGHHCTQPLHNILGAAGSLRASLYFYNNKNDIDVFVEKLKDTINMFENMS
eukprot:gene8867-11961_t